MNLNELLTEARPDGRTYALVHERLSWAEVLSAFGELDLSTAAELQAAVSAQLRSPLPLILDLAYCQYLDSTILRVLVRAVRTSPHRLGIVVPLGSRIRRIFEMTRLDDVLSVASSREEVQARLAV